MNKYISIIRCTAAALVLCCAGCTDQWDEHYADQPGVNGAPTLTLWEQIQQRKDLKNFADVCEKTPFRTSETNKPGKFTFANLLGKPLADGTMSNAIMTVFAPAITDMQRDSLLALLSEGKEWEVQTQFLANHIRRNRREITSGKEEKIYMLNTKLYALHPDARTLNGVAITECNVPATNGVLHILDSKVPFMPNLHEYLRSLVNVNEFAEYVIKGDSSYFDQDRSIEGEPDSIGQIHYLDSVFTTTNKYFSRSVRETNKNYDGFNFSGFGLNPSDEDSMYAMVIPSTQAYNNAVKSLSKYYRYAKMYENNTTRDAIKKKSDKGFDEATSALPSVEAEDLQPYLDTLQNMMTSSKLMKSLLFNMNAQRNYPKGTQEEVINAFENWKNAELGKPSNYLLTSFGDTLRTLPYRPEYRVTQYNEAGDSVYGINWDVLLSQADEANQFNPVSIFDGKTPIRMSNGLAYVVDNYNIDPMLNIHTDFIVEAEQRHNIYQTSIEGSLQSKATSGRQVTDSIMNERGRVSNGYLSFGATGTGGVEMTFKLPKVLSAKYDIYAVIVPEYYNTEEFYPTTFQATLNYIGEDGLDAKNNGSSIKMAEKITTDPYRVQTYLLFEDFEFPYCYDGLNNSYPTLTFTTDKQVGSGKKKSTTNNLCIDMIYLKAKH